MPSCQEPRVNNEMQSMLQFSDGKKTYKRKFDTPTLKAAVEEMVEWVKSEDNSLDEQKIRDEVINRILEYGY